MGANSKKEVLGEKGVMFLVIYTDYPNKLSKTLGGASEIDFDYNDIDSFRTMKEAEEFAKDNYEPEDVLIVKVNIIDMFALPKDPAPIFKKIV